MGSRERKRDVGDPDPEGRQALDHRPHHHALPMDGRRRLREDQEFHNAWKRMGEAGGCPGRVQSNMTQPISDFHPRLSRARLWGGLACALAGCAIFPAAGEQHPRLHRDGVPVSMVGIPMGQPGFGNRARPSHPRHQRVAPGAKPPGAAITADGLSTVVAPGLSGPAGRACYPCRRLCRGAGARFHPWAASLRMGHRRIFGRAALGAGLGVSIGVSRICDPSQRA